MENRGGVSDALVKNFYQEPSLVPPMVWQSKKLPATPTLVARASSGQTSLSWSAVPGCQKYAVQTRVGGTWKMTAVAVGTKLNLQGVPDAVAVSAVDRYGNTSRPRVVVKQ